jgi:hypothetical protein
VGKETAAFLVITAVHVIAMAVLVWAVLDGQRFGWRGWWPDDGGGGPDGPTRPEPDGPSGDGLPLPGADPAGVRLRTEHERLADQRGRARRPAHAPQPERPREPA